MSSNHRFFAIPKSVLGKIWTLPNTLLGLVVGLLGLCIAPGTVKIRLAHNAVCFYKHPFLRGPAGGLTLGNVILFQDETDSFKGVDISEHEKQHTLQAEVLGIFYLPLHILCLAIYGPGTQEKNPLERGPDSNPPRPW